MATRSRKGAKSTVEKGDAFEQRVADLLRACGISIKEKMRISGVKADLVGQTTLPIGVLDVLIECKHHERNIGSNEIKLFHSELGAFRSIKPAGMACFVSQSGFTEDARKLADDLGIWCVTEKELERKLIDFSAYIEQIRQSFRTQGVQRGLPLHELYTEQDCCLLGSSRRQPFAQVFAEWAAEETTRCLLVLADYGTGKTSMTLKYAADAAQRYQEGQRAIPIRLELRGKGPISDIRSVLLQHLRESGNTTVTRSGVEYFLSQGHFILFLDGLDELGIPSESGSSINALVNLADFIHDYPRVKILMTARTHFFRDESDIRHLWGNQIEIAAQRGTHNITLSKEYRACYILPFSEGQRSALLQKARPKDYKKVERLLRWSGLEELASRPILLDMILESIDELGMDVVSQNQTALYTKYTDRWLARDEYRHGLGKKIKGELTEILAVQLWRQGRTSVHWNVLLDVLQSGPIPHAVNEKPERLSHDMRTASFLIGSPSGEFSFAHQSFLEFFLARYLSKNLCAAASTLLRERPLSDLSSIFLYEMLRAQDKGQEVLDAFRRELNGEAHTIALVNLALLGAWLKQEGIVEPLAQHISTAKRTNQQRELLLGGLATAILECCHNPGFHLPAVKMKFVDTLNNPITDELICSANEELTLERCKAVALIGYDHCRLSMPRSRKRSGPRAP